MFAKIKNYRQYSSYLAQLRDVRSLGLMTFVVIVLLISWSGVKVIQTNYELQKQIAELQQQNSVQQLENNNLRLQNEYYNTAQYLELAARQNFGLADPGEIELIVPQNVAMAHVITAAHAGHSNAAKSLSPFYERNLRAWLDFFLHR